MNEEITYPLHGRGAWNGKGVGGTLNAKGEAPGRYYRTAINGGMPTIGLAGYRAVRDGTRISIDEYAVFRAAIAVQNALHDLGYQPGTPDGLWGPKTDAAVKAFQTDKHIVVDGIFGPQSARALFEPFVHAAAQTADQDHAESVTRIMLGTITLESLWDPAAVGSADSQDLGFGQINGPAHPTLSVNDRLNPRMTFPWIARLVESNLKAFDFDLDAGILAYNLGQGGTRRWIDQGRPDIYTPPGSKPRDVRAYIKKILAAADA